MYLPKVIWLAAIQKLKTRPLLSLQQRVSCVHLMSDLLGRHQQMPDILSTSASFGISYLYLIVILLIIMFNLLSMNM